MHDKKKHCQTWRLVEWMRRNKQFTHQAQAALDQASEHELSDQGAKTSGKGSLYRAGLTLADLQPGECGYVRRFLGGAQARLRLLEMGLTPGTHVQLVRAAAFGGPLDIQVRGYQLSLRREEAASVWLDDEDPER